MWTRRLQSSSSCTAKRLYVNLQSCILPTHKKRKNGYKKELGPYGLSSFFFNRARRLDTYFLMLSIRLYEQR